MKPEYKLMYMEMAEACARASKAIRKKVGCVLVNDKGLISEGLNGMPPDWPTEVCEDKIYANSLEGHWYLFDGSQEVNEETFYVLYEHYYPLSDEFGHYRLVTKPECRHAEVAALEKLWVKPNSSEGAKCFVTLSPCLACAIKLKTAKISEVYYKEQYRDSKGIDYLKSHGIVVEQI